MIFWIMKPHFWEYIFPQYPSYSASKMKIFSLCGGADHNNENIDYSFFQKCNHLLLNTFPPINEIGPRLAAGMV